MRLLRSPVCQAFVVLGAGACGSVPIDPGARILPAPSGVIRGTVVYQGPRPCSRNGHIVGNAVVLVFNRRNPPPPGGLASAAVNFGDVTGDVLFGNEPRYTGSDTYCPAKAGFSATIVASAPFEIAPVAAGSYQIRAFFDSTGNFLPEFKIRNLPERGDIVGGDIDTADALKPVNAGNPNYPPRFLPIDVGVVQPAGSVPDHVIPDTGFVADDVTVTIGAPLQSTRPYFYAQGEQVDFDPATLTLTPSITQSSDAKATDSKGIDGAAESDENSLPILTIPQDIAVFAPPAQVSPASANFFESKFPHLRLAWGVPTVELGKATAPPFNMQVAAFGQGAGFLVWQNAVFDPTTQRYSPQPIPEGNGVPQLWPQVVLTKLTDPRANAVQPLVLLQGITLLGASASDSLLGTAAAALTGSLADMSQANGPRPVVFVQDHLTVMLRPSVICFPPLTDPGAFVPGTLVTPHPKATTADLDCSSTPCVPNGTPEQLIAPPDLLTQPAVSALVGGQATGCLPMGRYAINVVYPDGQGWTVPNEAGACSGTEGSTDYVNLTCPQKPRPVLYSQGNRAVVEVVAAKDPAYCVANPVPAVCKGSQ
jgi:hypothetical protein